MQYPEISITNSKVATQTDSKTLEYYQSIYTHCKQRFNIPDGIETFKKTLYQYIENCINNYLFGDYNILEVRHNLYESLVHHSHLNTQDFNSQTLETYFQELNFNIIQYCKENYPVEQKFSLSFESETEEGKGKKKQKLRTTSNTPKTTAKHLQTPEQRTKNFQSPKSPIQQQEPILTSTNLIDYLAENQSEETESEQETKDSENKEEMASTYIAKISEFIRENSETSPQEWLDKVSKAGDANGWNTAKMLKAIPYFLQEMASKWFENLEAPPEHWKVFKTAFLEHESVMTYLGKFNKLLRRIWQLETNKYYSNAQILDQFITGLKDKLIKKAKNYKMAIKEANHTKLVNLVIGETSSAAEEKIDQLTKKPALQPIQQQYQQPSTQHYQVPARRLIPQNQFTPQNQYQVNNNRINLNNQLVFQNSVQPRPNHYHTQPSYLMMPEEQDFHHIALSEGRTTAQQQNPSYTPTTIPPARIAENANLSDIFSFEFEANESPFLLNNAAANEQKAITAIYTEAEAEGKPICLILDTLVKNDWLQKANSNLNWETQELTISYQGQHAWIPATYNIFNKCSKKAPAFEFELEKEKLIIETFMALESTSNWADETEQQYFSTNNSLKTKEPVTPGWNISYSKPEPQKQCSYIPLKYKDCHKKLSSMGACISSEEEYGNHICYYCKSCHQEQWKHLVKRSGKWNRTPCLTCREQLPDECDWIDVVFREGVCNQTCQYALLISEKVIRGIPFDAAYNSTLNKLYHYPHNTEMIFDLAMALINGATQENVHQMKESEYITYTFEIAGYNYENKVEVYHQIAQRSSSPMARANEH
ncbi:hypothetical protein G9A89_012081 [Geosiphon pyriformis]|nr:hypothetical protein G9A89_012081 [Geosiphon pyriformis]